MRVGKWVVVVQVRQRLQVEFIERCLGVSRCDLLDQLTFYGASRRFSLDFYCRAFGIPSPKAGGVTEVTLPFAS